MIITERENLRRILQGFNFPTVKKIHAELCKGKMVKTKDAAIAEILQVDDEWKISIAIRKITADTSRFPREQ